MQEQTSRCVGHCCKRFAIEHSYVQLQEDFRLWKQDPALSKIPDVQLIAPMVVPLASSRDGSEHVYTCKNLKPNGDCGIYETRPQMCRDFPDASGCHFWRCKSSQSAYFGMSVWKRIWTRWTWLKELSRKHK